jgi:hypothetical protein
MSIVRTTMICLSSVTAAALLAGGPAEARRGFTDAAWYEEDTETKGPVRGYSGPVWGGRRNYWCDYQRIPNRQCTTLANGREKCRVVKWTLKQYCY